MVHYLTVGHLDPEALRGCAAVPTRPLDETLVSRVMDEFPDVAAEFKDGYVVLPWHGLVPAGPSEEFALRLQQLTGCVIADRRNGRVIDAASLTGANKAAG